MVSRILARLHKDGISIRTLRFRDFESEINALVHVYNSSNAANPGFIPLTTREFRYMAKDLKALLPEKLILLAEKDKKIIGYLVALPDFNQVFRHIPSGKLFPAGFLKFTWYRRKIDNARILILGVMSEFRNRGIDIVLYSMIRENLRSMGINHCEASYVMENNARMNSILQKIGSRIGKTYRIYSLDLSRRNV
jgi:ribosomal protein S18 acetylase RimI-like enzyme